jgi:predicted NBD/HSP70 family sugar kinase
MGIVIDGEVYRGANGAAGEVGYLPLAISDPHDRDYRRRGRSNRRSAQRRSCGPRARPACVDRA